MSFTWPTAKNGCHAEPDLRDPKSVLTHYPFRNAQYYRILLVLELPLVDATDHVTISHAHSTYQRRAAHYYYPRSVKHMTPTLSQQLIIWNICSNNCRRYTGVVIGGIRNAPYNGAQLNQIGGISLSYSVPMKCLHVQYVGTFNCRTVS